MHADRTIEFHAQYGYHFKTRIPKVGRDFIFQPLTAELYMCGSSQYIFRLSLDEGRFMKPIVTNVSALNVFFSHLSFTFVFFFFFLFFFYLFICLSCL